MNGWWFHVTGPECARDDEGSTERRSRCELCYGGVLLRRFPEEHCTGEKTAAQRRESWTGTQEARVPAPAALCSPAETTFPLWASSPHCCIISSISSSSFIQGRATLQEHPSHVHNECSWSKGRGSDWRRMIFGTYGKKRVFEIFFLRA